MRTQNRFRLKMRKRITYFTWLDIKISSLLLIKFSGSVVKMKEEVAMLNISMWTVYMLNQLVSNIVFA